MSDKIQLNFNGFSTRLFLDEEKMSATNISLTASENLIQFNGAYGGSMNYAEGNYFRLNTPSFYELPEISCSFSCELTYEQILNFFNFLEDRGKEKTIEISLGKDGNKTFYFENCCYVRTMSLSTSENSLVTADYDFYVNSKKLLNEGIINDVERTHDGVAGHCVFDMHKDEKTPVGYWETKIEGFDGDKNVLDWKLTISQDIITKYYCGKHKDESGEIFEDSTNSSEPPLPDIMIGYPKMELSVSFLMDKDEFGEEVFKSLKDTVKTIYVGEETTVGSSTSNVLKLYIRDKAVCGMKYGKVISYSPSLNSNGGIIFSSTYIINQIELY